MENEKNVWVPTREELQMIDAGLADIEAGRLVTQDEVLRRIGELTKKLDSVAEKDSA